MHAVCHSALPGRIHCYVRVIRETCNTSAADVNVLKSVIYYAKFSFAVSRSCALGELQSLCYYCEMLLDHNRIIRGKT